MKMLTVRITMSSSLHASLLAFFICLSHADGSPQGCAKIFPDSQHSIPVELGKEFTATCVLTKGIVKYSADDVEWVFGRNKVPEKFYRKINDSAVSLTVNVNITMENPLKCQVAAQSLFHQTPCVYGIYLSKGYPPVKPENLRCIALQHERAVLPYMTCSWDPGARNPEIPTSYTLTASTFGNVFSNTSGTALAKSLGINFKVFPNHGIVTVTLVVNNSLGSVSTELLNVEAESFVKPSPPKNVMINADANLTRSLLVRWNHPIHKEAFKVKYHIRYCQKDSSVWSEIPSNSTNDYGESYMLQFLQPYTDYVVQIRCINQKYIGYWSNWSRNVTARTPEDKPEDKPDLWRVYEQNPEGKTVVKLIWKDPVRTNGKILRYDLKIINSKGPHTVQLTEREFYLKEKIAWITLTASNSIGSSPPAHLAVKPVNDNESTVEQLNCSVQDDQLLVNWLPSPQKTRWYLVEWVSFSNLERDWKRVAADRNYLLIGNLKSHERYNISVYPINHLHLPGRQVTVSAYLREGPPLKAPSVGRVTSEKNSAVLQWDPTSVSDMQGFITSYTIFYKKGDEEKSVTVGPDVYSLKLVELESDRQYVVHIMASNSKGSVNGSDYILFTKKYENGEIEVIVVLVCLGFLFFIVCLLTFFLKNRELIKKRLWPQVPDPSHSTVANWSPDCPVKAASPKEATLPDVSVVEVDVFDGKSLSEEDKAMLPLKKDKYFSEEHSSGIGGSSCMSSPRQSVSDSDESDSGQTTASTVQYSSVVAASGYKGQTPGSQGHIFARSESTQPLLDCEEHPEHLMESSGSSSSSSSSQRNSYFRRGRGLEQLQTQEGDEPNCSTLSFSPMEEEDTPTLTEDPPGPPPGYMPQQSGYRPQ